MNEAAQDDYSPLIKFLYILNECPDDEFEEQIQTVMNVPFFFRFFFFFDFFFFFGSFLFWDENTFTFFPSFAFIN